jgi:hypothetical protein
MSSNNLQQILLEELGYADSPGFMLPVTGEGKRQIPDVSGVYFVQNIPVVYFSRLSDADPRRLWNLYRQVWNQSKAPLLYVVMPQEIRVYNVYAKPVETPDELNDEHRLLRHLERLETIESARRAIQHHLGNYDRLHLDTGAFWTTPDGIYIQRENRADQRLLRAMDQVRRRLTEGNLKISNEQAYALLGRSVFIRYLEDRQILNPQMLLDLTDKRVDNYRDALNDLDTTYRLFDRLSERFNGDLFPVGNLEKREIRQEHLDLLGSFLDGTDLDSGQISFWPFDFRYIPIELISGIYDTFLRTDKRRSEGTYYTPLSLVDFMLDETLPPEQARFDMKILDPACGSGIFLVRAYQKLVENWQQTHSRKVTGAQLARILKGSIFGIDKQPEAVRVAAFSLYLAMLDLMSDGEIKKQNFRFPSLRDVNLVSASFFSPEVQEKFSGMKFDRVIGNPPWGKGTLTDQDAQWLQSRNYTIGEKQIAQAFLMYAPDFVDNKGELALLAPAKSTILVTSGPHEEFRRVFFENHNVRTVINFSALCYELFADSIHPAVGVFYQRETAQSRTGRLAYGVPKPSPLSHQLGAIVLDTTEIKYLDREELVDNPTLWKIALWGTPRDSALIERLMALPTLDEQAGKLGWKIAEGIQINGGDENPGPWLRKLPLVSTGSFRRYLVDPDSCEPIIAKFFHRPRTPEIVKAPLALIHQSPVETRCAAAFSATDMAYRDKITGILGGYGQENHLKWLVAFINSPLAQYYHFLTSTSWAVERGTIIQEEYERMPFLVPETKDPRLKKILGYFDQITLLLEKKGILLDPAHESTINKLEAAISELVFDIYGLSQSERQLVQDMIQYGIEFFYWSKQTRRKSGGVAAVMPPNSRTLREYAETFIETVTAMLRYQKKTLNAVVYQDGAPLSVIDFELADQPQARSVQVIESPDKLRDVLRRLDRQLLEQHTPTLYMRRHVRIYDGPRLYLVRPSEQRFWTRSQARADADDVLAEWLTR